MAMTLVLAENVKLLAVSLSVNVQVPDAGVTPLTFTDTVAAVPDAVPQR
jgi:hypothetical protein